MNAIASFQRLAVLALLVLAVPLTAAQALLDGRKFNTEAGYTGKPF